MGMSRADLYCSHTEWTVVSSAHEWRIFILLRVVKQTIMLEQCFTTETTSPCTYKLSIDYFTLMRYYTEKLC